MNQNYVQDEVLRLEISIQDAAYKHAHELNNVRKSHMDVSLLLGL